MMPTAVEKKTRVIFMIQAGIAIISVAISGVVAFNIVPKLKRANAIAAHGKISADASKNIPVQADLSDAAKKLQTQLSIISASKQNGGVDTPPSAQAVNLAAALSTLDQANAYISTASNASAQLPHEGTPTLSQPTSNPKPSWIYIGRQNGSAWNPNYFGVHRVPIAGDTISSKHWVNMRSAFPEKNPLPGDPNNYDLAPVIGVLLPKQRAIVTETRSIRSDEGGRDWWIKTK